MSNSKFTGDRLTGKGTVTLKIYEDGKLREVQELHNLIVTVGKERVCQFLGNAAPSGLTQIQAGTNGMATSLTDTAIAGGATPVAFTTVSYPAPGSILINFTIGTGDANGITIQEFGLLTADSVLFSRIVRPAIVKTSAISIVGTWQIEF